MGTLYHLSGWRNVIADTYGHDTYYLVAERAEAPSGNGIPKESTARIAGVLPLVHLKHFVFGNNLISMPFLDYGGVLADSREIEELLLAEAVGIGRDAGVAQIELRHLQPLPWLEDFRLEPAVKVFSRSHKVRMLLELPGSFDLLMKSFKSKLRSQIARPAKSGLTARIGHLEYLDQFYEVFAVNMRDLGSPVHSSTLMLNVMREFRDSARICMVFDGEEPVAGSVVVGFQDTLENPWASSLRKYKQLSPNMLLYKTMLEYACYSGFTKFDFGRSTPNEGTYNFKIQWGADSVPLHWHSIHLREFNGDAANRPVEQPGLRRFISYWRKMPVGLTKVIGPRIRMHIGL